MRLSQTVPFCMCLRIWRRSKQYRLGMSYARLRSGLAQTAAGARDDDGLAINRIVGVAHNFSPVLIRKL
jgi:hypothetical protein